MKPTFAQEEYANGLVDRLREEQQFGAEAYAHKVLNCQDRQEMSQLIDEMKRLIAELDGKW